MNIFLLLSALSGFSVIVLGALSDHLLHLAIHSDRAAIFHTALQYQMWHTILLVGLNISQHKNTKAVKLASLFFIIGIVCFSGILYLRALNINTLLFLAPIGGIGYMLGWLSLLALHR